MKNTPPFSISIPGKCRKMMEEEVIDNTLIRFLDMVTQQTSERLWMLDLGDPDPETNGELPLQGGNYGILTGNVGNIQEIEARFQELNRSQEQAPGKDLAQIDTMATNNTATNVGNGTKDRKEPKSDITGNLNERTEIKYKHGQQIGANSEKLIDQRTEIKGK